MQLRIATFNVENLFSRPKALNQPTWKAGQPAVDAAGELNSLFAKDVYAPADQKRMLKLLGDHGLLATRPSGDYLRLVNVRGRLFSLAGGAPSLVATGRSSWIGWVERKKEAIADAAIENTARVLAEVDPDVLVCVEVEDRPTLERFHDGVLAPLLAAQGKAPLPYAMVIDGNDDRGIDVGILSGPPGPLLTGTALVDAMALPAYAGLPGTYDHARAEARLPAAVAEAPGGGGRVSFNSATARRLFPDALWDALREDCHG